MMFFFFGRWNFWQDAGKDKVKWLKMHFAELKISVYFIMGGKLMQSMVSS
jgi:hypothetical protein